MIENNWYVILELEFDPNPVTDEEIIASRIEDKRKFWANKSTDFNRGAEYKKYLQNLSEIKSQMIGRNNIRNELIKDACEKIYGPVDKRLKQIGKLEIPRDMIDKISKKDKVSIDILERRARKLGIKIIDDNKQENFQELYDKYYKTKPQNADKFNGIKQILTAFNVETLYQFLAIGIVVNNIDSLPASNLVQRAKDKKSKEFYKNDSISGSGSKVCGVCEEAFKDEASKKMYDEYLKYISRKTVLTEFKELYGITDEVATSQYDNTIERMTQIVKDKKLAENILIAFCKIEKIPLSIGNKGDEANNKNIRICRCGCINDISDGRDSCQNCGMQLDIKCPSCGAINSSSINVCKCGFKFENIDKSIALCELARNALDNMEFEVTKLHLADASRYWPDNKDIAEVKMRLSKLESKLSGEVEKVKRLCSDKLYYEAKRNIENIRKIIPGYIDEAIESEINFAINSAEKYKEIAQNSKREEEVIESCTKAYELAKDCPGVKEIISKYPPNPASSLVITTDPVRRINVLRWNPSTTKGGIYYLVVRKENSIPSRVDDGDLIDRISMTTISDKSIVSSTHYFYAVFAERAGIYSKPLTTSSATLNLFEISGVEVIAGDATLSFEWDRVAREANVKIERIENGKAKELICNSNDSFSDKNLINDKNYSYRFFLQYEIGTKKINTAGIKINATPTQLPLPIEKIKVKSLELGAFGLEWEVKESYQVIFYYSENKPEFIYGDAVRISKLDSQLKTLMVQKTGESQGVFADTNNEVIYIVPVVIKGELGLVGTMVRASKNSDVNIKDIIAVNGKIMILIDLPKDISGFVVLYRNDKFPDDISDIKAKRKYISLKQYEYDSGLIIDECGQKDYYFSVFTEFTRDGEKEYSLSSDKLYSESTKEIITYSVEVKKQIFRKNIIKVMFESENKEFVLPDIDIMSSTGVVPMFKKDAEIFYQIAQQKVHGTAEYSIKIKNKNSIEKDTYIKPFLKDEKMQLKYQLKLKLKSSLKIN